MQKVRPNKFKWRGVFSPIRYNGQGKRCISRLQTQGIRGLYIYLSNSFLIRNWTCCTLSKGLVFVAIFNILKIITQLLLLLLLRNLRQWRNLKIFSLAFSFLCDLEQLLSLLFSFLFGEFGRLCNINLIHKHDHKKAYNFSGFLSFCFLEKYNFYSMFGFFAK